MDPLADYIRQNRDTYTREAIDQQLLDGGYAKEEIDAAWNSLPREDASQNAPQIAGGKRTPIGATFVILCIFSILIGAFLVFLTDIAFSLSSPGGNRTGLDVVAFVVNLGSLAVAIGLVAFGVSRLNKG